MDAQGWWQYLADHNRAGGGEANYDYIFPWRWLVVFLHFASDRFMDFFD